MEPFRMLLYFLFREEHLWRQIVHTKHGDLFITFPGSLEKMPWNFFKIKIFFTGSMPLMVRVLWGFIMCKIAIVEYKNRIGSKCQTNRFVFVSSWYRVVTGERCLNIQHRRGPGGVTRGYESLEVLTLEDTNRLGWRPQEGMTTLCRTTLGLGNLNRHCIQELWSWCCIPKNCFRHNGGLVLCGKYRTCYARLVSCHVFIQCNTSSEQRNCCQPRPSHPSFSLPLKITHARRMAPNAQTQEES